MSNRDTGTLQTWCAERMGFIQGFCISILTTEFKPISKFPLLSPPFWPFFFFKPLQNHKSGWNLKCFMARRQIWLQMRTHHPPRKPQFPLSSWLKNATCENIYGSVYVIVYCLWLCSIHLHSLEKYTVSFLFLHFLLYYVCVICYCKMTPRACFEKRIHGS